MEQTEQTTAKVPTRASRAGASRQLLSRKALQQPVPESGEALEKAFPTPVSPETSADPLSRSSSALAVPPGEGPPAPAAWSSEDEAAFQALLARRKAAGYRRRGRDASSQLLKPGPIKPNPDTVASTILALVGEDGQLSRNELLSRMATASFPHPKARAQDEGWCQGYVAGCIRNGFLAVAAEPSTHEED